MRTRIGYKDPTFPPAVWNHHLAVLEGDPITNNTTEAWHNRLKGIIETRSPTIYQFVEVLKIEQAANENEFLRLDAGLIPHNVAPKAVDRARKIFEIIDDCGEPNVTSLSLVK